MTIFDHEFFLTYEEAFVSLTYRVEYELTSHRKTLEEEKLLQEDIDFHQTSVKLLEDWKRKNL